METIEFNQNSAYESPWTFKQKIAILLWDYVWAIFCQWTPKPWNRWRLLWLHVFGCQIHGYPFVHQRARIQMPWNLVMHDRSCVGDRTVLYSLGKIVIGDRATVAQEAYICTGTHNFSDPALSLITSSIEIGPDAFIGARAFVMPGVRVGAGAVVGAASVVTRDVPDWTVSAGNPCRLIGARNLNNTFNQPLTQDL